MHNHAQDAHADWMAVNITDDKIYIHDIGHMYKLSVTNDAENVVYKIVNKYGDKRIIYRDSDGRWDELLHDGDQFTGYAPYTEEALT